MKNINFVISAMMCLFISCGPKILPTQVEINEEMVTVKLSHQTTKNEMDSIAQVTKEYGVTMDYNNSTFFDDGKLRILSLVVTTPTHSGRTNSDLIGIQTRYVGFHYNALDGKFSIGEMDGY